MPVTAQVQFLEHFRYRRFLRTIREAEIFPDCAYHPLSIENATSFFQHLWDAHRRFETVIEAWEGLSLFTTYIFNQPASAPMEMLRPFDFSKFVSEFLPVFRPEIAHDYDKTKALFEWVISYFMFLRKNGRIRTVEPILAAQVRIFRHGRIMRIRKRIPEGPEWAVVHTSPKDGSQQVFTFTDVWLLALLNRKFEGHIKGLIAQLNNPHLDIRDRLPKRAHFARLLSRLEEYGMDPDQVIKGLCNDEMLKNARRWFFSGKFIESYVTVE